MDKNKLKQKIEELEGLTNEEKSELIKLLRSQKSMVWFGRTSQKMLSKEWSTSSLCLLKCLNVPLSAMMLRLQTIFLSRVITSKRLLLLVIPMQG